MSTVSSEVDFSDRKFSVAEAAEHLRVSRSFVFKLIKTGKLKAGKLGRRTIITGREIEHAFRPSATAYMRNDDGTLKIDPSSHLLPSNFMLGDGDR